MDTPNIRRLRQIEREIVEAESAEHQDLGRIYDLYAALDEASLALTDEERNS